MYNQKVESFEFVCISKKIDQVKYVGVASLVNNDDYMENLFNTYPT